MLLAPAQLVKVDLVSTYFVEFGIVPFHFWGEMEGICLSFQVTANGPTGVNFPPSVRL
jgi:hypothetical protein